MLLRMKDAQYQYELTLPKKVTTSRDHLWTTLDTNNAPAIRDAVNDLLFRLWTQNWKKSDQNTIGDPTICLLALAMLKPDGSFNTPTQTTPFIAKIVYCQPLVFLSAIHSQNLRNPGIQACDLYSKWFTEKVDSTFNTLFTLQHKASALAYSETSMPRIIWTDRRTYGAMWYHGSPITFQGLQKVFSDLEKDAINMRCSWDFHCMSIMTNYSMTCPTPRWTILFFQMHRTDA